MDTKNYDLTLGDIGPYNKEYLGATHIADKNYGITFNVEAFPGFFRRNVIASKSISGGPVKMWNSTVDLTRFTYRYELEWKDRVYCDVTYTVSKDKRLDVDFKFVNNTSENQSLQPNLAFSLQPQKIKNGLVPLYHKTYVKPVLNEYQTYIDAINYVDVKINERYARQGTYLGEAVCDFASGVQGTVLSGNYFNNETHYATYNLSGTANSVGVRYIAENGGLLTVIINDNYTTSIPLTASKNFTVASIKIPTTTIKTIKIIPNSATTIDGILVGDNVETVSFIEYKQNVIPTKTLTSKGITLSYEGISTKYNIVWYDDISLVRRIMCNDIGVALEHRVHDHVFDYFDAGGKDCYEVIVGCPVYLSAGESKTVSFTVYCGVDSNENIEKTQSEPFSLNCNNYGEKFKFSQNFIATNALLNTVYPIYNRRGFIKHNTPGRFWDCLYSWDSGMIGVGLSVIDFNRAYECLYTYLTPVNDKHSPFIFAGSVVPTQIFLYKSLFDKYPNNREKLKEIYPMIKSYYKFFADMDKDVCQVNSGLIKTWHLFYNSGGWDDYPPQKYLRARTNAGEIDRTYNDTTPVITTAITVLISKILKNISLYFNMGDSAEYDAVILKYSTAIEKYLWDEKSGYYSYAVHDKQGNFKEFLTASDGSNFNMGLDGAYPYIAGVSSSERSERVKKNIIDGLLTKVGVSAVDTRASYYSSKGYWNGSVWIPHEWVLFTSLLDRGEVELAYKIADIALSVWQKECYETYNSFEHFMIENGRGAGFPQFSGLSTPILDFYRATCVKNAVTVGFNTIIESLVENDTNLTFETYTQLDTAVAFVCLNDNYAYTFIVNGKKVEPIKLNSGLYSVKIEKGKTKVDVCKIV